jgi:hypothetical protein
MQSNGSYASVSPFGTRVTDTLLSLPSPSGKLLFTIRKAGKTKGIGSSFLALAI